MMLSGLSQQTSVNEKMQTQPESVTAILETAQRDLRILLHLRPIELEQKSLVEDSDYSSRTRRKSDLKVSTNIR